MTWRKCDNIPEISALDGMSRLLIPRRERLALGLNLFTGDIIPPLASGLAKAAQGGCMRFRVLALQINLALGYAYAQTATGVIHGVVRDASGAVVAGVRLTLTDQATNQSREQVSSPEGNYDFCALPNGVY
jgi:hypothetical protein